jgi:hypothetical protein
VQEEVGDGLTALNAPINQAPRKHYIQHAPVVKAPKERIPTRSHEQTRTTDDKIAALKSYRKAKGLCFTCGEKWARDHKCQPTVQLHVVQELVEFFSSPLDHYSDSIDGNDDMELMQLADIDPAIAPPAKSIVLSCAI